MNETPWKVVGFEKFKNERDEECVRLYVERLLNCEEGHTGDGLEVSRYFFKTEYVKYEPKINHIVIITAGRYAGTIGQVFVLGEVGKT